MKISNKTLICCLKCFLHVITIVSFTSVFFPAQANAQDSISIAVPYLPHKIELQIQTEPSGEIEPLREREPVGMLIMRNISTPLIQKPGEGHPGEYPLRAKKISRTLPLRSEKISQIWEVEFSKGTPLDKETNMSASVVKDSLDSLRTLYQTSLSPNSTISSALNNIHSINFADNQDRFSVYFNLLSPMQNFPDIMSRVPIINKPLADIFGASTGVGTNAPFFGHFRIVEYRPNEEIKLERNDYFGFSGNLGNRANTIYFKVFNTPEMVMRSLRSGSISMIAFPCDTLIEDARRDTTLLVIPSPLTHRKDSLWTFQKTHWEGNTDMLPDEALKIRTDVIIVRKSLKLSPEFTKSFDLSNISKGEL